MLCAVLNALHAVQDFQYVSIIKLSFTYCVWNIFGRYQKAGIHKLLIVALGISILQCNLQAVSLVIRR